MTNIEFAVLGLIVEQPRHGYDVELAIQQRGMRDWTEIGFSSIYYLLGKLEKAGLVTGRLDAVGSKGPKRKVYAATKAGRSACRDAIFEALSEPYQSYPPILLGLANLPGVTSSEAVEALNRHRDELSLRRGAVEARRKQQQPLPDFVEAMFDYSRTMMSAELKWLERTIKRMEKPNGKD